MFGGSELGRHQPLLPVTIKYYNDRACRGSRRVGPSRQERECGRSVAQHRSASRPRRPTRLRRLMLALYSAG